jgi:hypothetical protein
MSGETEATASPTMPPVQPPPRQVIPYIAIVISGLALAATAITLYRTQFMVSESFTMSPSGFEESYATNPTEIGFVVTNAGNRPAILIQAYLGFYEPGLKGKLQDGRTASLSHFFVQGWTDQEKKRNNLPRTFGPGETAVIYLSIPPPAAGDRTFSRRLVLATRSSSGQQTLASEALIAEVARPSPTGDRYMQLRNVRRLTLDLLGNTKVIDEK